MAGSNPLSEFIDFVLVEPETAANVGAVCRALKNTGFSRLHLVNPQCDLFDGSAKALAHRSFDLIENATYWDSCSQLKAHFDLMVATTVDVRDTKKRYVSVDQLSQLCSEQKGNGRVALLFGRERNGLTTEEISMCDVVSSIPLANPSPAINLSQAVMLYAFLISQLKEQPIEQKRDTLTLHAEENQHFIKHVTELLRFIGVKEEDRAHKEVFSRLPLMLARDKRLVMFVLSRLKKKLADF